MRSVVFSVGSIRSEVKSHVERRLDKAAHAYLDDPALARFDFSAPSGENALVGPDSMSWRIFKNPVSLFIGGVTAVILELAEPRVRTGVWEFSSFRKDPVRRLKRTGLAAMVTVYGAHHQARQMIDMVNRMHQRVEGVTPHGEAFSASDPELLTWVQATAAFGFLEAYAAYVSPLSNDEKNCYYAESQTAAELYGCIDPPSSLAEQQQLFADMTPRLEASDIIVEFQTMMKKAAAFPGPAQLAQHSLVRAAVDLVPDEIRAAIGLDRRFGLRPLERQLVARMGRRADRLMLRSGPAIQACRRMGLPDDFLY